MNGGTDLGIIGGTPRSAPNAEPVSSETTAPPSSVVLIATLRILRLLHGQPHIAEQRIVAAGADAGSVEVGLFDDTRVVALDVLAKTLGLHAPQPSADPLAYLPPSGPSAEAALELDRRYQALTASERAEIGRPVQAIWSSQPWSTSPQGSGRKSSFLLFLPSTTIYAVG